MTEFFGYVYETTNLINNKKYIGKCVLNRINDHKKYLGSGTYLKRAINKYGKENFKKEILEYANSSEELNLMEERYILERDAVNSKSYYNLKYESIGGDVFTNNPNKELIRESRKEQMSGKGNHQFDKEKSTLMIDSVKSSNKKSIMIDNITYESLKEASEILGIGVSTICYRLTSKRFQNYIRLGVHNPSKGNKKNKSIIIEIDLKIYSSLSEASRELKKSVPYIKHRLNSIDFPNYKIIDDLNN